MMTLLRALMMISIRTHTQGLRIMEASDIRNFVITRACVRKKKNIYAWYPPSLARTYYPSIYPLSYNNERYSWHGPRSKLMTRIRDYCWRFHSVIIHRLQYVHLLYIDYTSLY